MRSRKPKSRKTRRKPSGSLDSLIRSVPDQKSLPAENLSLSAYVKVDSTVFADWWVALGTAMGQVGWLPVR
jgi:hypothetical protein